MGVEFLKRTKRTISKSIDTNRANLSTPDLLTRTPEDQPRCLLAAIAPGACLITGDVVIVETHDSSLLARRGNTIVARFKNPPAAYVSAINQSGGVAGGIIRKVNTISKTVDVSIC